MDLKYEDPPFLQGQLTTGFLSKHIGSKQKFNETNTGLGYATKGGLLFGGYRNSLDRPSFYAAKEWTTDPYHLGPVEIRGGLLGGAVTGYGKPITPLLMPEVLAAYQAHQLALGLVPPVKGVTPAVMALQYRRKF